VLPIRRWALLILAIFFLFSMFGFLIDMLDLAHKPLMIVLAWTLFTGLIAVVYLLVLAKAPRLLIAAIALHLVGSWLVNLLIHRYAVGLSHPSIDHSIRLDSIASLILSLAACICFLLFIQTEGRRALQLQTELSLAHEIQRTLVPSVHVRTAQSEIYGISLPSEKVGGDLVDVVTLSDGSTVAYVIDVAGHGLPAGILMGMIKTAIRTHLFDLPDLCVLLERLNNVLPAVKEPQMYATCAMIRLPARTEGSYRIDHTTAAHPSIVHLCNSQKTTMRLSIEQLPLGLLPSTYLSEQVFASPGDLFLMLTDGVLEVENSKGEDYGFGPVERALIERSAAPLQQIAESILKDLRAFGPQRDDQTLLVIRVL
jgi:hypothetical protein